MRCSWWEDDQIYNCIDPSQDFGGGAELVGCDVNCFPCQTDTEGFRENIGVNPVDACRWVRPSTTKWSCNAYGINAPLRAGIPQRLPRIGAYYEIAPIYTHVDTNQNFLCLEHFNINLCAVPLLQYWDAEAEEWTKCPNWLVGFTPYYAPGKRPTCWWFFGNSWFPGVDMQCQSVHYGWRPMLVHMRPGPIGEYAHLRLGQGCANNVGALCWGHRKDNRCHAEHEYETDYYTGEHHSIFNYVLVDASAATFATPDGSDDEWAAIQAAKTAALNYLATHDLPQDGDVIKNFDQLNSARRYASPDVNHNATLTLLDRSWNMYGGAVTVSYRQLPTVCEFSGSYLLASGHRVVVEYVIVSAEWTMSLVAQRRKSKPLDQEGAPPSTQLYGVQPMVRHRIEINMGLRVRFPDGDPRHLERTWLETPDHVVLTIPPMDSPWPRVEPAGMDRIIFADSAGRVLHPPLRVVWEGERGNFSDPPTEDIFDHDYWLANPTTDEYHCKALARGFTDPPFPTPAVESHPEHAVGDRKRIWGGQVTLRFPDWS